MKKISNKYICETRKLGLRKGVGWGRGRMGVGASVSVGVGVYIMCM